jgi:hypothetical protein
LNVGIHPGAPVTDDCRGSILYQSAGGTINRVIVDVSGEPSVDFEREAQKALPRHWGARLGS